MCARCPCVSTHVWRVQVDVYVWRISSFVSDICVQKQSSESSGSAFLCTCRCPAATYPEHDCWNFSSLPAKSSDRSHVTLIPSPVIRAHWERLACSALLDWMIPIYPQTSLPRPLRSSETGAARFMCSPVSWLVRSLCQPCYWACWSVAINLCKGGEVLTNRGFAQLSDKWLGAQHLPQTVDTFITAAVSTSWAAISLK